MFHLLWNITIWPIKSMLKFLDFLFWGGRVLFWIFEVVTEKQIVAKPFSVDG